MFYHLTWKKSVIPIVVKSIQVHVSHAWDQWLIGSSTRSSGNRQDWYSL